MLQKLLILISDQGPKLISCRGRESLGSQALTLTRSMLGGTCCKITWDCGLDVDLPFSFPLGRQTLGFLTQAKSILEVFSGQKF